MKIIVMGTGPFAVPTCEQLLADGHDIPLVVTRPLAGKSKKPPPRPVFVWANQASLPLFEPSSINDASAIETLAKHQADLFFVCDYGQILSNECLQASGLGGINLHGSLLPRHRGAAPVQWALLRGDSTSGVTVIHMTPRLDAGPALAIARTDILPDETAGELEPRLAQLGVAATTGAIQRLADWKEEPQLAASPQLGEVQDKSLVTKAPRFSKADGQLDFRLPAEYLVRLVRACQPWPGTFAELQWESGKQMRVIVRKARSTAQNLFPQGAPAGTVRPISCDELAAHMDKERNMESDKTGAAAWESMLAVKTQKGSFLIGSIQPAGKREMEAKDFLRGHPVESDCRFILPDSPLNQFAE